MARHICSAATSRAPAAEARAAGSSDRWTIQTYPGAGFGSSTTGVGNLVGGTAAFAASEMMIGSWGPFDPGTEEAFNAVQNVQIVNPQSGTNLQTIPDPTGERGSDSASG